MKAADAGYDRISGQDEPAVLQDKQDEQRKVSFKDIGEEFPQFKQSHDASNQVRRRDIKL